MTQEQPRVYSLASGEIDVWVDGGIHLKVRNEFNDPAELSEGEATELAELLLRLVKEQSSD
ncbi:MAG: hypothetical protein Q8N26_03090 [Myxococcales bacterium]|nr:hypothetical protein [Myxococcales bacterium]